MTRYDYDIAIIGGGGAGITSAILASGLGKRTIMLDTGKFGGECTWSGCVPSKALLKSAQIAREIQTASRYGVRIAGSNKLSYSGVMKNVDDIVRKIYSTEKPEHFRGMGIDAMENTRVRFKTPNELIANKKRITAGKIVIATGSSPAVPPIEGLDSVKYFTNENIFKLKKLPPSMAVLGGGPIGVELASAFNRLGVKVTLFEMAPSILPREDSELTGVLAEILAGEGLAVKTGARITRLEKKVRTIVHYTENGRAGRLSTDALIIAAGRKPNTENLNLEGVGVSFSGSGIDVNERMETTVKGVYAAGDVTGGYQFSHVANYQAIVATSNAILPINRRVNYDNIPWITFTDPELARSGLTEEEARQKYGNRGIRVFRSSYRNIDRGRTDRKEQGVSKIICRKNGKILGIHILGERAGELLHEPHMAKSMGIPLYKLNDVIHAYPGYSDVIKNAAREAYVDKLQNNIFIKTINLFRKKK